MNVALLTHASFAGYGAEPTMSLPRSPDNNPGTG